MLSKNQIKLINGLLQKKYRNKNNLFIAEGVKCVNEFLNSEFVLNKLFCTSNFKSEVPLGMIQEITALELKKISNYTNPNKVLGLFEISKEKEITFDKFTLVLDGVNDPGNLGTIIRLCDWFGVEQLICSNNTVDCYNPKVVQSTMGSLSRISIIYTNIELFINKTDLPIYSAIMQGKNVYKTLLPKNAVLVMGNEANGIRKSISNLIPNRLAIPNFGKAQLTESLNVATATSILLSEFKRS